MVQEWLAYIDRLDNLLERAVIMCVKNTLQKLYKSLHGEGTMGPTPIFKLEINLSGNQLDFNPKIQDIADFLGNMFDTIIHSVKSVTRLVEKFRLPKKDTVPKLFEIIKQDDECIALNCKIQNEIFTNQGQIAKYNKMWMPFRSQWELDKDLYMQKYEEAETDPLHFDLNIGKYSEIANKVSIQESTTDVYFCVINSSKLKHSILSHIDDWQCRHTDLLRKKAYAKITGTYVLFSRPYDSIC